MDYQILTATTAKELAALVNEQIARGWAPCGGVSASTYYAQWENERKGYTESEERTEYAQAMTSTQQSREAAARARDY
jgi:hypothetical protein